MFSNGKQALSDRRGQYAMPGDFCEAIHKHMKDLYLLAFVLTADHATAEQCFVKAVGECMEEKSVFKEWTFAWAKRVIVKKAIELIFFEGKGKASTPDVLVAGEDSPGSETMPWEIAAVAALRCSERFVYVITMLEGHSIWDCSLMLGCSRDEALNAQMRALLQLARRQGGGSTTADVVLNGSKGLKQLSPMWSSEKS